MSEWRPVVGYEGLYEVSSIGDCRNAKRMRHLSKRKNSRGYWSFTLFKDNKGRTKLAHTMVLEAFVCPRHSGMQAAHNNGIRTDNRVSNLRWATASENNLDKGKHGTFPKGANSGRAKLTDEQVARLRSLHASGVGYLALMQMFSLSQTRVHAVIRGETYR